MPLTASEIALMKDRKMCGINALKILDEIRVRSTNYVFDFSNSKNNKLQLQAQRVFTDWSKSSKVMDEVMESGLGNCDEKARLCLGGLSGNPLLKRNGTQVTLCHGVNYDHVFVALTTGRVPRNTNLSNLGTTAMIVDGWTEDWYFPNLPPDHGIFGEFSHMPNPRQFVVRNNTKQATITPYQLAADYFIE